MNYSFEYIDIILLAMIAGFIFLRLRGILGKRTGYEGKIGEEFKEEFSKISLNWGEALPSKPVLFPKIPLSLKNIKPAIIANKIISIYSKL